jgi:hypothetical protein
MSNPYPYIKDALFQISARGAGEFFLSLKAARTVSQSL